MPGTITLSQAQGLYTEALATVFSDRPKLMGFLRSFFPSKTFPTYLIDVLAQRSFEFIAMDVYRGSSGNRNTWSKSTQKIFETYYFREKFDVTRLQLYEKMFSGIGINADVFAAFISSVVDKQSELRDTIERSIEVMISQIFHDGIIIGQGTGMIIDYKRKAESMVDLASAGGYWTAGGTDPFSQMEDGGVFLRTKGKVQGGVFNMICGSLAKPALFNNTKFLSRQNLFNLKLDDMNGPQKNSLGANFHGQLSTDNYKVNVWTYPEFYQDNDGNSLPYINEKEAIMLPENPKFFTAFGAVPQIVNNGAGGKMIVPKMGEYVFSDNLDEEARTHYYNVESAPLPVLDAVDTVYTMKVVA